MARSAACAGVAAAGHAVGRRQAERRATSSETSSDGAPVVGSGREHRVGDGVHVARPAVRRPAGRCRRRRVRARRGGRAGRRCRAAARRPRAGRPPTPRSRAPRRLEGERRARLDRDDVGHAGGEQDAAAGDRRSRRRAGRRRRARRPRSRSSRWRRPGAARGRRHAASRQARRRTARARRRSRGRCARRAQRLHPSRRRRRRRTSDLRARRAGRRRCHRRRRPRAASTAPRGPTRPGRGRAARTASDKALKSDDACSCSRGAAQALPDAAGDAVQPPQLRLGLGRGAVQAQQEGPRPGARRERDRDPRRPGALDDRTTGAHRLGDRQAGVEREQRAGRHRPAVVAGRADDDDVRSASRRRRPSARTPASRSRGGSPAAATPASPSAPTSSSRTSTTSSASMTTGLPADTPGGGRTGAPAATCRSELVNPPPSDRRASQPTGRSSTIRTGGVGLVLIGPDAEGGPSERRCTGVQLPLDLTPSADASETTRPAPDPALARLLDVRRIFVEPAAAALPRGQEVLARWPDAELVEIASHTAVPYGPEDVDRWVRIKTEDLVLGVKKSLTARPNGRSSDFVAPSTANGCAMACAYCYVPRRKGYANPVTVFANIEQITGYLAPPRRPAGDQARARPGRPARLGLRHRRELRLLRRRPAVGQRARPRRAVPRPADGEGVVRHQARQPRPARLGPAGPHPRPLLAHAAGRQQAARPAHLAGRRADRRDRRLRRRRVRGARQPLAGRRARRLARRTGRSCSTSSATRPGRRSRRRRPRRSSS